ncbi:alpha 1,2 mannosyltransferase [Friedmanniomyces endolithicus]|nr:alpha 1,2 mannosyltransferase [Friedmanniomyces endolithicus]KAK0826701.1 alpha 1,2 mannosyltransferase [Friedmanniomyces endolithicus]
MSRRVYLFLVCLRLYFALSPSYIHPDEHFQGPEIIAGEIFSWPSYKTWEFTSSHPIRSIFPLWLIYGPPLTLLKWVCDGAGYHVSPMAVFYTLRLFMFLLSFVLQDWALHELLPDKRERSTALLLVASSYVTWTYQMHTFSNSIETIVVLWSLVLMRRMTLDKQHTQVRLSIVLAFLGVLGVFNRITFPAFLLLPAIQLAPHIVNKKPVCIAIVLFAAAVMTVLAVAIDTEYYTGDRLRLRRIFSTAVVTPWNNLAYNLDSTNLAQHGIHPFWQHFAANLPQLIGPALPLLIISSRKDTLFWAGLTGTALLSCFRHQEPRFLLPAVPLLLSSIKWPTRYARIWLGTWVLFNAFAAVVFGRYHQAGVVPVQAWLAREDNDVSHVFWWKTYSPPRWILGERNDVVNTTDLMGMPKKRMYEQLAGAVSCQSGGDMISHDHAWLVAPLSSSFLGASAQTIISISGSTLHFEPVYTYRRHVGLDDLDWAEDGVWGTLQRVVGERGLGVYGFYKVCEE